MSTDTESHNLQERSRLLTLVFTDLVDSVGLKTRLGDSEASRIIGRHLDGVSELCRQHGGREVLVAGDGNFLVFDTPSQAVEFALVFQEFHRKNPDLPDVRIGVHMGEITERPAPPDSGRSIDIEGLAVDIASRIQGLALPRQILLSYPVFDNARQRLDNNAFPMPIEWRAHGRYDFQGIEMAIEIFEVGRKGTAEFQPPPGSSKAHRNVSGDEESTLGWRPAQGLELPGKPKWTLVKKLGEGGFGDVWLAEHSKTRDQHVIKFCYSPDRLRTLKREVTLFRLLKETLGDRSDIARVLDYQFEETPYYLEMEFTGHHTLTSWLQENGGVDNVPLEVRLEIVAQVADAIAAAHSVGVLHKDIKPSNIMITDSAPPKPRIRMIDFGIGAVADRKLLDNRGITATGLTEVESSSDYASSMAGTRLYMAPELIEGKPATTKSDIYSLGVLLYQLASGRVGQSLAFGWERDIPDPILREDIEACVDGEPEKRMVSAEELAARLRNLSKRHAQRQRALADQQRLATSKKRRRFALVLMGLLGILFIMVAQYAYIQMEKARTEEQLRLRAEASHVEVVKQSKLTEAALERAQRAQYFGSIALAEASLRESRLEKAAEVLFVESPENFLHREWGWLLAQTSPENLAVKLANIFDAEFTHDGRHIIAGNRNIEGAGTINVFDASSGELTTTVITNSRLVWNLNISPDGKYLATASSDRVVTIVDLETFNIVRKLNSGRGIVRDVQFSPDGQYLAAVARDHTVRLWKTERFTRSGGLRSDNESFTEIDFSPDSRYFVTGSLEGRAIVYETETTRKVCELDGHLGRVLSVAFLKNGRGVATADSEGLARIFPWPPPDDSTTTLTSRLQFRAIGGYPAQVVSSSDGSTLYVGNDNGQVTNINSETGVEIFSFSVDQPLWKLNISKDDRYMMACARWSMRMLDLERLRNTTTISHCDDWTTLPQNALRIKGGAVSTLRDGTWRHDRPWRTTSGLTLAKTLNKHNFIVESGFTSYSPDRSQCIQLSYNSQETTVTRTSDKSVIFKPTGAPVNVALYSPDGRYAVLCHDAADTIVYDAATWQKVTTIPRITQGPSAAIFTRDSSSLIIGDLNGTIHSFDPATGELKDKILTDTTGMPLCMTISRDGKYLAVGLDNDRGIVINLENNELVSTLYGHVRYIFNMQFLPNSTRLATLSRDNTVKLWDVPTGRELVTIFNPKDGELPLGIVFHPNGRHISVATSEHRILTTEVFPWNPKVYPRPDLPMEDRVEIWKRRERLSANPAVIDKAYRK